MLLTPMTQFPGSTLLNTIGVPPAGAIRIRAIAVNTPTNCQAKAVAYVEMKNLKAGVSGKLPNSKLEPQKSEASLRKATHLCLAGPARLPTYARSCDFE